MTRHVRHYSAARGLLALRLFTQRPCGYGTVDPAIALNIGERASRGLISRMVLDGYLEPIPDTRHARYRLADGAYLLGLALVDASIHANIARQHRAGEPVQVGDCLRAYRRNRGISQEALADALGFDHLFMAAVEAGTESLPFGQLGAIAQRLGVDPFDIVFAPR